MKCNQIQNLLLAEYLDDEMDKNSSVQIKEHLDHCLECKQFYQEVLDVSVVPFEGSPDIKAPEDLWEKVEARIEGPVLGEIFEETKFETRNFFTGFINAMPALVSLVFVAFVIVSLLHMKSGTNHRPYAEIQNEEEFHYIFSRNRVDLSEEEEGFGTIIEDLFL